MWARCCCRAFNDSETQANLPLCSVFWKGKWYVAQYGQFDGYPEGQGVKIVNFLSVARNIDNLKAGLENRIYEPTQEEIDAIWDECEAWDEARRAQTNMWQRNMFGINQLYPSLARETSAGILGIIARASRIEEEGDAEDDAEGDPQRAEAKEAKKIPVHLQLDFANDSLFCEWAYVVDLDKEVFEVYGGSEKKHDGHRFRDVGDEQSPVPAFFCSFNFAELFLMKSNSEFLDKVKEASDERAEKDEEDGEKPDLLRYATTTGVPLEVIEANRDEEDDAESSAEGSADGSAHGSA
jgi:hypothetical protein